jgi:hypothetical protein
MIFLSHILSAETLPKDTGNLLINTVVTPANRVISPFVVFREIRQLQCLRARIAIFFQKNYKAATCFWYARLFYCTHACGGGGTEKTGNPSGTKISPDTPNRLLLSAKISPDTPNRLSLQAKVCPDTPDRLSLQAKVCHGAVRTHNGASLPVSVVFYRSPYI